MQKSIAEKIANNLTNEQIIYLFIANELWDMTEIFVEESIEDIEDTCGEFSDDNWFALDYVNNAFDNDHVNEVITAWKALHDEDGEYQDEYSTLEILDMLLGENSSVEYFQNIVIHVAKETGSYADCWNPRSDTDVEIIDILNAAGSQMIVNDFLTG